MNRRRFAAAVPAVLAMGALGATEAKGGEAQSAGSAGTDSAGAKPKSSALKDLSSGTFKPGPGYGTQAKRVSHRYLTGMLKAGNIQLEMHETIQEVGAEHEPVGTHLHNEIWMVQRGVASLFINGTEHRMEAGDVGLVCAGDEHWIKNVGESELAYFVVTVGPPEG